MHSERVRVVCDDILASKDSDNYLKRSGQAIALAVVALELLDDLDNALTILRAVEWAAWSSGLTPRRMCPLCCGHMDDGGHQPTCKLAKAITKAVGGNVHSPANPGIS